MNADTPLLDAELTDKVIGVFYSVFTELGYGFLESVYENALFIALRQEGLQVDRQVPFPVVFRNELVGEYRADLIVESRLIVEVKAGTAIVPPFESQLLNYLKATGLTVGLILNFGPKPTFKRKIFTQKNPRLSAQSA